MNYQPIRTIGVVFQPISRENKPYRQTKMDRHNIKCKITLQFENNTEYEAPILG